MQADSQLYVLKKSLQGELCTCVQKTRAMGKKQQTTRGEEIMAVDAVSIYKYIQLWL